jgi:AraC-like DNA-binding protein
MMSNEISSTLNSEPGLASIPMAQGGLSRLAIARLKSAGVPVAPLLKRVGLTPELIAQPEERLNVRSQIALLDEAAIALKDDCLGFTLARDFDPREIGLLYYVMACSQTLGDALKRIARYSKITNEALVFGYREGNRLIISLSYSGVPRHSDRHQIEFCMFAALRICRAISSVLPHGRVLVNDVARSLAMSERTLARKLSDEGLNFTEILQQLRRDLAVRYLDDRKLHVSKIAWLLGFHEVSAFTHAFKRWTGKTPRQMRTVGA